MIRRQDKKKKRARRHRRIRAVIKGTALVPRLAVFHSNRFVYAQLIDDEKGHTLAAVSGRALKKPASKKKASPGIARAYLVGKTMGERARKKGIERARFDRGGFAYHGQVKAVAEGAREAGLRI